MESKVVALVAGAEKELGGDGVGIVESHGDLAADDVFFFFVFVLGESGAEDHLEEGGEEEVEGFSGAVNIVNGAVKTGVGVPLAAGGLDFLREGLAAEAVGSFKNHVLEKVGDS